MLNESEFPAITAACDRAFGGDEQTATRMLASGIRIPTILRHAAFELFLSRRCDDVLANRIRGWCEQLEERTTSIPIKPAKLFVYVQCLRPNVIGEDADDTPRFQYTFINADDPEEAYLLGGRHFGPSKPRETMLNDFVVELP